MIEQKNLEIIYKNEGAVDKPYVLSDGERAASSYSFGKAQIDLGQNADIRSVLFENMENKRLITKDQRIDFENKIKGIKGRSTLKVMEPYKALINQYLSSDDGKKFVNQKDAHHKIDLEGTVNKHIKTAGENKKAAALVKSPIFKAIMYDHSNQYGSGYMNKYLKSKDSNFSVIGWMKYEASLSYTEDSDGGKNMVDRRVTVVDVLCKYTDLTKKERDYYKKMIEEIYHPISDDECRVEAGDTLSKIAEDYGLSMSEIIKLNGITDANNIKVGQVLKIRQETGGEKQTVLYKGKEETVKGLQRGLNALNEYSKHDPDPDKRPLKDDGIYGTKTNNTLTKAIKTHGKKKVVEAYQLGQISQTLKEAREYGPYPQKQKEETVKGLQRGLNALNEYSKHDPDPDKRPLKDDGIYGPKTNNALTKAIKTHGKPKVVEAYQLGQNSQTWKEAREYGPYPQKQKVEEVYKNTFEDEEYKIKAGDTLSKISRDSGISISEIAKENNITDINIIKIGQVLKIRTKTGGEKQRVLYKGKEETVKGLQRGLNTLKQDSKHDPDPGKRPLKEDGVYGPKTNNALTIAIKIHGKKKVIEAYQLGPISQALKEAREYGPYTQKQKVEEVYKNTFEDDEYKIKAGDTLSKISRDSGISMSEIAKENNITDINIIKIGQVLKIPTKMEVKKRENDSIKAEEVKVQMEKVWQGMEDQFLPASEKMTKVKYVPSTKTVVETDEVTDVIPAPINAENIAKTNALFKAMHKDAYDESHPIKKKERADKIQKAYEYVYGMGVVKRDEFGKMLQPEVKQVLVKPKVVKRKVKTQKEVPTLERVEEKIEVKYPQKPINSIAKAMKQTVLYKGQEEAVKGLQRGLDTLNQYSKHDPDPDKRPLQEDGIYGPKTNNALTKAIQTHGEKKVKKAYQLGQISQTLKEAREYGPYTQKQKVEEAYKNTFENDERPEKVEINEYIWRSIGDSRTRSSHAARGGRHFSLDNAPDGGHPGQDYNCRCYAEPVVK